MGFLFSFICIALLGSIFSALAPSNSNTKIIKILISLVLTITMISVFTDMIKNLKIDNYDMNTDLNAEKNNEIEIQTIRGINIALTDKIKTLIYEYSKIEPNEIYCEILYENDNFYINRIIIDIEQVDKAPLILYLSNNLGLSYSIFEFHSTA